MDFGASTSGFEARLCHLLFYLFGIESCYSTKILATATHPTLLWAPIFHQQEDEDNGFTFFNAGGLRRVFVSETGAEEEEGRVVAFTKTYSRGKWLSDIAFTSDFCNNYSHSASPASLSLTSPRLRPTRPRFPYLMSSSPSSRFPKSQVPTHAFLCPCPTLYTADSGHWCPSILLTNMRCRLALPNLCESVLVIFVSVTPITLKLKSSSSSRCTWRYSRLRFRLLTLLCSKEKQSWSLCAVFLNFEKPWGEKYWQRLTDCQGYNQGLDKSLR